MTPGQEAFVRVREVGLSFLDDASQSLEHLALIRERLLHLRFPGQAKVLDHGDPNAPEGTAVEGWREHCVGLVNRYRRAAVKTAEHTEKIRAICHVAGHGPGDGKWKPAEL